MSGQQAFLVKFYGCLSNLSHVFVSSKQHKHNLMQQNYAFVFRVVFLFALLGAPSAAAQLPNFTLSVTHTDETCTGNACLDFSVSGIADGASVVYNVYLLPDVATPVATTSENDFCGLTSGNYLVVATQSLNGENNSAQQSGSIASEVENLSYALSHQSDACGTSATITVNATSGTPLSYEILSGPVTAAAQSANTFPGLPAGTYSIRVFDSCGEGVVQDHTVFLTVPTLDFSTAPTTTITGCNTLSVSQTINTGGSFAYPLTVTYTTYPPSGAPQTVTTTVANGDPSSIVLSQDLVLYDGQTYSYDISITDSCGNTYTDSGNVVQPEITPLITTADVTCDAVSYVVFFAVSASITEAPGTFAPDLPFVLTLDPATGGFPLENLPVGNYVIAATDVCGIIHFLPLEVTPPPVVAPIVSVQKGCQQNYASIYVRAFPGIQDIVMTAAPGSYPATLPQNLNFALDATLAMRLANLPAGNYVFEILNTCGNTFVLPYTVEGLAFTSNVEVFEQCGSFNLGLAYSDNSTATISFWLQEYNTATGNWGHPATGQPHTPGSAPNTANSLGLENNVVNYNLAYTGLFRVISFRTMFSVNEAERNCINVLEEFEFLGIPVIDDLYSFSCDDATYDVIVEAHGIPPLEYRLTSLNGVPLPTPIENGTSNIFTDLQPGTYNFQVEDGCHNIVNRDFDILDPLVFQISATAGICEGQPAALWVPAFAFLNYNWYKDDPNVVLSSSGTFEIPAMSASDLGTYHVHIFADDPNSCIDFTLNYTLPGFSPIPNAGNDTAVSYCGPQGTIDLNGLLTGNYTSGGVWQEATSSGALVNNYWDSAQAAPGTYVFTYAVSNDCGPDDTAQVTVAIQEAPETPVAFVEQDTCEGQNLQLLSTYVEGATYQWTGPNGFSSSQSNPVLPSVTASQSGTYTVQAFIGDCASATASVDVAIGSLPEFTAAGDCVNGRMMLSIVTTDTSFNMESVTVEWNGSNGFSATGNPIDVTGQQPGTYSLNISSAGGCSRGLQVLVFGTLCAIPQGVSANNDGSNDNFNLSGLGENLNVKIFNRYGMVVYEMDDYVNQWHGQCKDGTLLPSATYYYYIQSETGDKYTGWVYLMHH